MPFCDLNGIKMFYEDRGSGIPIVFIHPPGMGRKVFYYQQLLVEHFRIILPDLSGHGDTIGIQEQVTISNYAKEMKMLLDGLQIDKAMICGYSSGGIVAQEFALNYPERVIGVILAGGFAKVQSMMLRYEHLIGMYMVKHSPHFLAQVIAGSHTEFEPLKTALITHMSKANRQVWFRFYEQSLNYSCLERLQNWYAPLLLIYGSNDLMKQHIRTYKDKIDFRTVFIKRGTHQVPVRNWRSFNQIIAGFTTTLSLETC